MSIFRKPKHTAWLYRHYPRFNGGQMKVLQYSDHIDSSKDFRSKIVVSPYSLMSDSFLRKYLKKQVKTWSVKFGDVIFLAGEDWNYMDNQNIAAEIPIINFIQGIRHADENQPHFKFLTRKAIRICVSTEVKDALENTGLVNGPLHIISNGIELPKQKYLPKYFETSTAKWLLIGYKNREMALAVYKDMQALGLECQLINKPIAQKEFHKKLNQSQVVLHFPHKQEGFYMPPLEAMARNKLVITPDCIGNRSFCTPETAIITEYSKQGFLNAVQRTLQLTAEEIAGMLSNGQRMAYLFSLEKEKESFLKILDNAYDEWNQF